jgi:hypothetical protein
VAAAPIAWPTFRAREKIEQLPPLVRDPVFHAPY